MKIRFIAIIAAVLAVASCGKPGKGSVGEVWSVEKANEWAAGQPWFCGLNYIPAYAINYTAMWDKTTYSHKAIDRELSLMEDLGLNCARVVLQYAVYEDDPKYFKKTLADFLSVCDAHGVKVMPIFFDDCAFGVNTDPKVGRQPEPLEGWYAWAWSPSPGYTMVVDEREHPKLEKYVKDVMTTFKDDDRIFAWDLYNEPCNTRMPQRSMPLLKSVFKWGREVNPSQPLTAGVWNLSLTEANEFMVNNSDIITYHIYSTYDKTLEMTKLMEQYGRPVICTEWMNRVAKSTIRDVLPVFQQEKAGCMLWGLVNGKTQTHLSWGHRPENLPYTGPWQHDLYHGDFTPYDQEELDLLKAAVKSMNN